MEKKIKVSGRQTSITDQPKNFNEADEFNIKKYEDGLTSFIRSAATPLTIALQGEWGSGKTSLMYTLKHRLCDETDSVFKGIWLNTWEYSLMSNTEITLVKILYQIISKIAEVDGNNNWGKEFKDKGGKFVKALFRTAVGFVANGDSSAVDEIFTSKESSISDLRKEMEEHIKDIVSKDKSCKGLIFFIDDLDRINPSSAVQLMELMKNIFTIENCIFILAIDYEVVVKGLRPKFGDRTSKNEHEFRQFFDKIIQVPFSMPVTNYEVSEFVINALKSVGYFEEHEPDLDEYHDDILNLIRYTVGYNPRSIKRLINSASLVKCIHGDSDSMREINKKFLNLAFISLQVVYPQIYNLLLKEANFTKWNDKKFLLENHYKELTDDFVNSLGGLTKIEFADEPWEQALKLICESDDFLNSHFSDISHILNVIRDRAPFSDDEKGSLNDTLIEEILKLSMTTNTASSFDTASETTGLKIMDDVFSKLAEELRDGISIKKLESDDRSIALDMNCCGDHIKATIATKKSGPDYLLDFKTIEDKNKAIDKDKTNDLDQLRKELEDSLRTGYKWSKFAIDRVKISSANGQAPIPEVKIRITCNSEDELSENTKIRYLADAISKIAKFHVKCVQLL